MPFTIHVVKKLPETDFPENEDDQEAWLLEEAKNSLYSQPLGAGGTVFEYWSSIAKQLNLELIAQIYNDGLELHQRNELRALKREVGNLRRHWKRALRGSSVKLAVSEANGEKTEISLQEHLAERRAFLMKAIEIALRNQATLKVF